MSEELKALTYIGGIHLSRSDGSYKCVESWYKEEFKLLKKALKELTELKRDIHRYFELAPVVAERLFETPEEEDVVFDDLDAIYGTTDNVFPYTGVYKEYLELKEKLIYKGEC